LHGVLDFNIGDREAKCANMVSLLIPMREGLRARALICADLSHQLKCQPGVLPRLPS